MYDSRRACYSTRMTQDWTHLIKRNKGQCVPLADDETKDIAAAEIARMARDRSMKKGTPDPLFFRVPDTLETFLGYEVRV